MTLDDPVAVLAAIKQSLLSLWPSLPRKFKTGQIVWLKVANARRLAKVTHAAPMGVPFISYVRLLETRGELCVPDCRLRPTRWWQRDVVCPAVALDAILRN